MIHISQVILGMLNFIENVVAPKLPSMSHMGAVITTNIARNKLDYISSHVSAHMKNNSFVNMLELINSNDEIDFVTLENALISVVDKQGYIELKGEQLSTLLGKQTNLLFLEGLRLDKKGITLLMQYVKES